MKRLFSVIIFALLMGAVLSFFGCDSHEPAVKARKEVVFDCVLTYYAEYEYDESGNKTKSYYYSEPRDGELCSWDEYEYTEDGQILLYTMYDADGAILKLQKYEYQNGNKTKLTNHGKNEQVINWYEYSYDANGNLTETVWYKSDGSVYERELNEYSADGSLLRKTTYDRYGLKHSQIEYSLGKTEFIFFDEMGNETEWYTNEYDDRGNMVKQTEFAPDGSITSGVERTYDQSNNPTSSAHFTAGVLTSRSKSEYDANGNCIKTEYYDGNGSLLKTQKIEYYENGERKIFADYNSDGAITSYNEYYDNGDSKKSFYYNADGSISRGNEYFSMLDIHIAVDYGDGGVVTVCRVGNVNSMEGSTVYYSESEKIQQIDYYPNYLNQQTEYTLYFNQDQKICAWDRYEYNSNGQPIKRKCYEPLGSGERLVCWYEYEYEENKLVKQTKYSSDGNIIE